ncbi:MAG: tRNA lysidine(34) synthetase TilS [Deltaproteobacteria bacterium HGW-Deltaproteobacteria-1]|jgi:tRNA(Ile)-lysidine synthase|nr:MAG: tRNA lysidine(34) synthetase TilS [Deltaproteobacteria bacterium HGW-Deltaproteobacteria-1]
MIMIKKIEHTIKKHHLLEKGDTVVVALSGGADSCALLLCLVRLSDEYGLKLVAAHFNHGLRQGQSDEDEVFCRSLAQKLGVDFFTQRMPDPSIPRGVSPEDYFRRERYRFLDTVAADRGADKIALGHHMQDQAETVLLNILRGSGLDGLKGFLPMRDCKYIRPLIGVTRQEIIATLKETGFDFREDSTNSNHVYLRNRMRGELIPLLQKKYNPRIEQNLVRMAEIVRRDDDWISMHVDSILTSPRIQHEQNEVSFSAEYFKSLHEALGFRLVKALLEGLSPEGRGFSSAHIQAVVDLVINSPSGKIITLPHRLRAQKEYDRVVLHPKIQERTADYEYPLMIPGIVDLKERKIILSARRGEPKEVDFNCVGRVYFDEDKIRVPLLIRNRRKGDWFEPLGTNGSQKIKKLFIDRKVPGGERDSIALIADKNSIIWIENMHISERVKVTHDTKNVLILEIRPL